MKQKKAIKQMKYDEQKERCQQFILQFQDYSIQPQQSYAKYGKNKYLIQMQKVANKQKSAVQILIEDLEQFFTKQQEKKMAQGFRNNTMRYISIFEEIVAKLMPIRDKILNPEQQTHQKYMEILKDQRNQNINNNRNQNNGATTQQQIPLKANQHYDVFILFGQNTKQKPKTISELTSENIGQLVICKAIVIRTSQIKPQLMVATYACQICGCENYLQVYESSFKPLTECRSRRCMQNQVNGKLTFLPGHSTFKSSQQMKIQQTPDQLKRGSMPRSLRIQLKGSITGQAFPGDVIMIQGIMMPTRRLGFKHSQDIIFDCQLVGTKIVRQKKKYVELYISEQQKQEIYNIQRQMDSQQLYQKLSRSIAPQIYGLENVKKALLLQMIGGITKQTQDNLRIRGEINIALFGDPGIAKSQLLKHISHISPRAVYTTGKGSSGVGLTAAIVIDPNTKQLALQAGALVLADMGVCCIDQFDKMDDYDRTAIHEVMEQQTVSITKAGIVTTLNARTAILAAANPLYGRYNMKQSLQKNVNMPAALLSRFDLIFILLDKSDKEKDIQLARHIGKVHQNKKTPTQNIFSEKFIRNYIALSKQFEPTIPEDLHEEIIKKYIDNRQIQTDSSKSGDSYTTMRSLLALIRLSQARARLRFSEEVTMIDVIECQQIIHQSQVSVLMDKQLKTLRTDTQSMIFQTIKTMCNYNIESKTVSYDKVQSRILSKGMTLFDLQTCVSNYTFLGVLEKSGDILRLIQ